MTTGKFVATALLCTVAAAAEERIAGKWNCANVPAGGGESPWTLLIRDEGAQRSGSLTDGEIDIPLTEIKLVNGSLSFRFSINGKPYGFAGSVAGNKLEGKYSGEEASGTLRCARPPRQ